MIVNRALVREVLQTSVAVTFVILSIFIVVRSLGFLQQAVRGDVPVEAVLTLVVLKTVGYLDVIIPLMMYIAILMVLGRWNRDNEMIILAACGISPVNFLKPLSWLVLIIGGVVAAFSFWLTPLAIKKGFDVEQEYRNRSEVAGVIPGTFMETKKGRGVYFVEKFDREADRGAVRKMRNAGQVCTSPTRFFVHERIFDAYTETFVERAAATVVGSGLDPQVEMGPLANERRVEALSAMVEDACDKGAELLTGGRRLGDKGYFFQPTVLANVPENVGWKK